MSRTAFVGNLSFSTTDSELSSLFSEVGTVVRARIGTDRETGKSRGFAFVEFETDDACAQAIAKLNGRELDGRRLRVNDADDKPPPRAPRPPGPGGARFAGGPRGSGPGGPRPGGPRQAGAGYGPSGGAPGFAGRGNGPSPEPGPIRHDDSGDLDGQGRRRFGKGSRRRVRAKKRSLWS